MFLLIAVCPSGHRRCVIIDRQFGFGLAHSETARIDGTKCTWADDLMNECGAPVSCTWNEVPDLIADSVPPDRLVLRRPCEHQTHSV